MSMEEYTPTTMGSPYEDMVRYMEYVRTEREIKFDVAYVPAEFFAKLTPEQITEAEAKYGCKIKPRIVYKALPKLRPSKEEIFKTSSPKEYGMSLMKRRRK